MFDSDSYVSDNECELTSTPVRQISQEAVPQRGIKNARRARKRKLPTKLRKELDDLTSVEEFKFDPSNHVEKEKGADRDGREKDEREQRDKGKMKDTTNTKSVLVKAKAVSEKPQPKRRRIEEARDDDKKNSQVTVLDQEDKDLLLDLARKVEGMEKILQKMYAAFKTSEACKPTVKQEGSSSSASEDDFTVNGINLLCIPARDAYAYGLTLLDSLFSKEELSASLLFKSKSEKPALDHTRVEKLLACIDKRYGNNWNIKTLTSKANQKCRDTKM